MLNDNYDKSYIIDATGIVLKYWFTIPPIKTQKFLSISALVGFSNFVKSFLINHKPKRVCFAFDESLGTCFRNNIYSKYKQNRPMAPDELKVQFKLCRELLDILGLQNFASTEYEADDLLFTISRTNFKNKIRNIVITNDKDLFQIINKKDIWWNLKTKKLTYDDIYNLLGFSPKYFAEFQGLMGDSTDCIPGAPGIGSKTAKKLISHYKTLDEIYDNISQIPEVFGSKYARVSKILLENKKIIYTSKKLAKLVSVHNHEISDKRNLSDIPALKDFFEYIGLKKFSADSWLGL